MITPPIGAERHQLVQWSTPRLLRYFKSRRLAKIRYGQSYIYYSDSFENPYATKNQKHTYAAMKAELDFIQGVLNKREHVERT